MEFSSIHCVLQNRSKERQSNVNLFFFFQQANDINQQYEEHYLKSRDIDGRLFFDRDETVVPPKVEM